MINWSTYKFKNYNFTIVEEDGFITNLTLEPLKLKIEQSETKIIKRVKEELEEYFLGVRKEFGIPIKLTGTVFLNKVWEEMQKIPYGKTLSYQELARKIGNEKACRAVGSACHNNKILILIPCHRVVGKNSLGGFYYDLNIKKELLDLECKYKN